MTDTSAAQSLAQSLLCQNRQGVSWRALARTYGVAAGTLCRIAKSGGQWLPRNRKILKALGLIEPKKRTEIEKAISRMARQTKKDVLIVRKK